MRLDEMGAEVSWNDIKLIDTMGYITATSSIDLTMGIVGNGVNDLTSPGVADTLVIVAGNKWVS